MKNRIWLSSSPTTFQLQRGQEPEFDDTNWSNSSLIHFAIAAKYTCPPSISFQIEPSLITVLMKFQSVSIYVHVPVEASFKILFDSVHRTFIARVDPQIRSLVHASGNTVDTSGDKLPREICIGILYCLHSMNSLDGSWLFPSVDKVTHHLSRWRAFHPPYQLLLKWNSNAPVFHEQGEEIEECCYSFTELLFERDKTSTPELRL